ncbi:MAG: hypothetical protein K8I02_00310, partial [Candidatus Methylomirabilis sp.]|nr:hypothetical protein [Deltaproteobacteria bacterium]
MVLRLTTSLACTADAAWGAMKRKETFFYVAKGFLGVSNAEAFPEVGAVGQRFEGRLLAFGILPLWKHRIEIAEVDEARRRIRTREGGGPVRVWNHTLLAEPKGPERAAYTDEVEFRAGALTPLFI